MDPEFRDRANWAALAALLLIAAGFGLARMDTPIRGWMKAVIGLGSILAAFFGWLIAMCNGWQRHEGGYGEERYPDASD